MASHHSSSLSEEVSSLFIPIWNGTKIQIIKDRKLATPTKRVWQGTFPSLVLVNLGIFTKSISNLGQPSLVSVNSDALRNYSLMKYLSTNQVKNNVPWNHPRDTNHNYWEPLSSPELPDPHRHTAAPEARKSCYLPCLCIQGDNIFTLLIDFGRY